MRKIKKGKAPEFIKLKNKKFLLEFSNNPTIDVNKKWKDWRGKDRLKEELRLSHFDKCCYCERVIPYFKSMQIEHFKPKSRYRKQCFDYKNLFICCDRCNGTKLGRYDKRMINPGKDDPSSHLHFNQDDVVAKTENGKVTIELLDMNDSDSKKLRCEFLNQIKEIIDIYSNRAIEGDKDAMEKIDKWFFESAQYYRLCIDNFEQHYKKIRESFLNKLKIDEFK